MMFYSEHKLPRGILYPLWIVLLNTCLIFGCKSGGPKLKVTKGQGVEEKKETDVVSEPPTASLKGVPEGVNNQRLLSVSVEGENVAYYRYKIAASTEDCKVDQGYGDKKSVSEQISDDISSYQDGIIVLCVLGMTEDEVEQLLSEPATAEWVKEATGPSVIDVTSSKDAGIYVAGEVIDIELIFSKDVQLEGSGTPTITLENGADGVKAYYESGSGTKTLTFKYTVKSGDFANPLNIDESNSSITLGSGQTLKDALGNDADLAVGLDLLARNKSIRVDAETSVYVSIPKEVSGLSYLYFIMKYEASLSDNALGDDTVTTQESDLSTCSYRFHVGESAYDASCGDRVTTAYAKSIVNRPPATNITWQQAFYACRNASNSRYLVRLPTEEEWLRASQYVPSNFATLSTVYTNGASPNCNTTSGTATNTGERTACVNGLGVYDMAGNLGEWVDERMVQYNIGTQGESRFGFGPIIGRSLKNGIDQISRRFHRVDPGSSGLALALGAHFDPVDSYKKQYGNEVATWQSPATKSDKIGFRCVALIRSSPPSMSQLALPKEPIYTSDDLPSGTPGSWVVPENLFVKDTRPEELSIAATGTLGDAVAEGQVSVSWHPWTKEVCNPDCTEVEAGFSYYLYRFVEPTHAVTLFSTPWALTASGSSYTSDVPLNPIAVNSSKEALFEPIAEVTNCSTSSLSSCSFVDRVEASTGFSNQKIFDYILVAKDSDGNSVVPRVQQFTTPYLTGAMLDGVQNTFRLVPRYRRGAVFLIDEGYQAAQNPSNVMIHVPLDKSGLDHDYFIQKFEAAKHSGDVTDNSEETAGFPLGGNGSTWSENAAQCNELWMRNPAALNSSCGSNSSDIILKSKSGTTPLVQVSQGAFWKGCRNTSVTDANGLKYYFRLPTGTEWWKAADWGDLNHDGTIDVHTDATLIGQGVSNAEFGLATGCHTDGDPDSSYTSDDASTAKCKSRYGVRNLVGNLTEWVDEKAYELRGYDNGINGLSFNLAFPSENESPIESLYDTS